ncbi:MAG: tRNA 2-thiouridine(34) synthase MnmA [Deltaproteobacteria bacterium]|nr:tRNA 2-thiouridine(34) synthase MnmA [Deltaproteobacteria bacterium]
MVEGPMSAKRVIVAMSGGVDSSVALAVLKEEGYDCVGVSMQLWDYSKKDLSSEARAGSCCSLEDIHDARSVADRLGVPFYVVNMENLFSKEVVDYFIESYGKGLTPNPCIKCNQILKFDALLKKAIGLEGEYLATGHYARIEQGDGPRLLKSYFLFTITKEQMKRVLFPVGGLTKAGVRAYARRLGLKTSDKPESQEICFVEEPGYARFLSGRIPASEGEIVDASGRVLGVHKGLFSYTVGQRKGLNLSGGPFYVTGLDTVKNRLVVGCDSELFSSGLSAVEMNWINDEARLSAGLGALRGITAKIRYRHAGAECGARLLPDGSLNVSFTEGQRAVAPGQAVVLYSGDEVLGGGWIKEAIK